MSKEKIVPLEDILIRFEEHKKEFKENLEKEELLEPPITVDRVINEKKALIITNDLKKKEFINDLKSELGEKLKTNPIGIKRVEKPKRKLHQKIGDAIKAIFTRF